MCIIGPTLVSQAKAQEYLDQHKVSIYALLPTMQGANYDILSQALDEMKAFYREQSNRLANPLLWFGVFLRRTTMLSLADKERISNKMTDFESLLDENPFVQKRTLEAEEKGLAKGREEGLEVGRAEDLQKAVITIIEGRFPPLKDLAQQRVLQVNKPDLLNLLKQVAIVRDEDTARFLLVSFAA